MASALDEMVRSFVHVVLTILALDDEARIKTLEVEMTREIQIFKADIAGRPQV